MRTYGRVGQVDGAGGRWAEVDTDSAGFDDQVWLTTLVQVLKLNLGESPFYANFGLPAHQSVLQQIAPDAYMTITQQQFAPHFAALIITRQPAVPGDFTPRYNVNVTFQNGSKLSVDVAT